jgi:transcriptional regulator GlxA family with amidase domain
VTTSSGLRFIAQPFEAVRRQPIDTLIVAGGYGINRAVSDRTFVRFIAACAQRSRRTCSVCTGAFALAEAGLLDGRRATTHWAQCLELGARYPRVEVEPDPIFICDRNIWTSAGVTAGIDLALALVEQDHGRPVALAVARQLVVFLKRPGGQSQFSALLAAQTADGVLGDLQKWILENLGGDLSVEAASRRGRHELPQFRSGLCSEYRNNAGQSSGAHPSGGGAASAGRDGRLAIGGRRSLWLPQRGTHATQLYPPPWGSSAAISSAFYPQGG